MASQINRLYDKLKSIIQSHSDLIGIFVMYQDYRDGVVKTNDRSLLVTVLESRAFTDDGLQHYFEAVVRIDIFQLETKGPNAYDSMNNLRSTVIDAFLNQRSSSLQTNVLNEGLPMRDNAQENGKFSTYVTLDVRGDLR